MLQVFFSYTMCVCVCTPLHSHHFNQSNKMDYTKLPVYYKKQILQKLNKNIKNRLVIA